SGKGSYLPVHPDITRMAGTIGYTTAVVGGLGLGLLLGSEFAGTYTTLLGAALTIIAIGTIAVLSSRKRG
ncbi:MAG: hypothetical protein RQ758_02140, partial [Methanomicrobiaceae archaeon]|nr:hypothetical protein [Methanomicrobiaceae archaeon]